MKKYILLLTMLICYSVVCRSQNINGHSTETIIKQGCLFLSDSFSDFDSAMLEIENTRFSFIDTYYPISKNISGTEFYGCEKKDGHMSLSLLIVKTKNANYIFRNVSKTVWINFRKSKSADIFFHRNIMKKYENVLHQ
jgi:hypothetical protein